MDARNFWGFGVQNRTVTVSFCSSFSHFNIGIKKVLRFVKMKAITFLAAKKKNSYHECVAGLGKKVPSEK